MLCRLRPQYTFSHSRKTSPPLLGMVSLAIALPPPSVHEIRLESDMFVTRVNFDFRIAHCEPRYSDRYLPPITLFLLLCPGSPAPSHLTKWWLAPGSPYTDVSCKTSLFKMMVFLKNVYSNAEGIFTRLNNTMTLKIYL